MSRYFNICFWEYDFYNPHMLWFLFAIPVMLFFWEYLQKNRVGQLKYASSEAEQLSYSLGWIRYIRWGINTCYALSMACLVLTLAEPYNTSIDPPKIDYKNGIDIILSIDASGSMLAQDFEPNRLEVAKRVAKKFVDSRKGDRVGLVVYEGEAYTACPATLDYKLLKEQITAIEPGYLEPGTAIGSGLGVAVTRLRSDSLPSKVIILLTDGSSNTGPDPMEAAELAKQKKCKVYTIGVGANGMAPTPVSTPFGVIYQNLPVEIDEGILKDIAELTNGKYFRAQDEKSLEKIYAEIDKLEKRKMEDQHLGIEPPLTLFPFFIWSMLFSGIAWGVQRLKFKLDD
ncbi:MAG: von Willebrand factor type [Fluviicola sp.]|uniref:vWA domain-containing protein n=1 Tax=Fluviicola sp. TaxID=1917219 RepID=UPI002617A52D|nr:VWA domain-containing protein [Fluviicola sp.]MDF3027886.1 von Willebrand factor type [Fluviicola sp.]